MKLKRKILVKSLPPAKPLLEKEEKLPHVSLSRLAEFSKEMSAINPNHTFGFIREKFEELFDEFPPDDVHIEMLKLRIQYELVKKDYEEAKVRLPERVRQNWEASKVYNVEKLVPSLRYLIKPLIEGTQKKTQQGEENMKPVVKKTSSKPEEKKLQIPNAKSGAVTETVTQSYIRLFQVNGAHMRTDEQLASEMCRLHPDKKKYTVKDIKSIRNMYNAGKLSGQPKKPMSPAKVVEPKKK